MKRRIHAYSRLGLPLAFWSTEALPCATCGFGEDASTLAFQITTAILTIVPLLTIGGILYWIRGKYQKPAATPPAPDGVT